MARWSPTERRGGCSPARACVGRGYGRLYRHSLRLTEDQAFSSQSVLLRYPAPIAMAYRRFFQQQDSRLRLDSLFSTLQAALRYLATLGVSDLFHCLAGHQAVIHRNEGHCDVIVHRGASNT